MKYTLFCFVLSGILAMGLTMKFDKIEFKPVEKTTNFDRNTNGERAWNDKFEWLKTSPRYAFTLIKYFEYSDVREAYVCIVLAKNSIHSRYFFVAFSKVLYDSETHMISELKEDANEVEAGAKAYLDFFGDEFIQGYMSGAEGKQVFIDVLAKEEGGDLKLLDTLPHIRAILGIGQTTDIDEVHAHPQLFPQGGALVSVTYSS